MKKSLISSWIVPSVCGLVLVGCSAPPAEKEVAAITLQEVNDAQQAWCDSLVNIAKTYAAGGDYKAVATKVLNEQYNYNYGPVLFKPTLTFGEQTFRMDIEAAAAYFIGGNPEFPDDKGFALKPWTSCRYTNAGVVIDGDYAFTMGNVFITDTSGAETMVDKFFAFKRGSDGKLRLAIHKSALPYNPE